MYSKFLSYKFTIHLLCVSYFTNLIIYGLRIDYTERPQVDKSGWRTLEFSASKFQNTPEDHEEIIRDNINQESKLNSSVNNKSKKLIEWDDDEFNDLHNLKLSLDNDYLGSPNIITASPITQPSLKKSSSKELFPINSRRSLVRGNKVAHPPSSGNKIYSGKYSKLIYHGQIKENQTIKEVDGIKMYINTRKPVTINRRSVPNWNVQLNHPKLKLEESKEEPSAMVSLRRLETKPSVSRAKIKETQKNEPTKKLADPQINWKLGDRSEWRPISLGTNKTRLARKTQKIIEQEDKHDKIEKIKLENFEPTKWKPIMTNLSDSNKVKKPSLENDVKVKDKKTAKITMTNIIYGTPLSLDVNPAQISLRSSIEEPFDDDGILIASKGHQPESLVRRDQHKQVPEVLNSQQTIQLNNRWTPVETTTLENSGLETTTTTNSITTTTTTSATTNRQQTNGTSELAQKSASDLNYIYSSQPVTNSQSQTPGSYYSNYIVQPQPQLLPQPQQPQAEQPSSQLTGTVIDTVSGQTPEMIDRAPEPATPVLPDYGYSMPQSSVSFQPAQPLPNRPAPSYGAYGDQSYQPARQQPAPVQSPPVRQSPNQVVRQEHHYHYYNQQQSQRQEAQSERQFQPINNQPTSQVIRELQPLLISQPIIQQAPSSTSTTTPAPPQIIREIIKEVPAQSMQISALQVPRIIPQPIPIQIPVHPTRGLESQLNFSFGPPAPVTAQRIIRQISSSIPTVSMRMPALPVIPQIRLPIQLPVRLTNSNPVPSVTRQTGSFVIPPMPKKTTTYMTETQAMPTHTTIMHTTQFTPATRTTVYTTDHQTPQTLAASTGYRK